MCFPSAIKQRLIKPSYLGVKAKAGYYISVFDSGTAHITLMLIHVKIQHNRYFQNVIRSVRPLLDVVCGLKLTPVLASLSIISGCLFIQLKEGMFIASLLFKPAMNNKVLLLDVQYQVEINYTGSNRLRIWPSVLYHVLTPDSFWLSVQRHIYLLWQKHTEVW